MRILILGDSTSFTGGYRPCSYPVALAQSAIWPQGTRIINPSVAGLTGADAARYFIRYARANGVPDAIVIYLGNCDACATLYPKGRATWIGQAAARWNRFRREGRHLNPFRPFTFDPDYRAALERPEHPADFSYNIESIIQRAKNARIILVEPAANEQFIAGSGKGNFIFYRIFGIPAATIDEAVNLPEPLASALRDEASGNTDEAQGRYRAILRERSDRQLNDEVRQIAANNLAVLHAERGEYPAAVQALEQILPVDIRPEIVLFNLYRIELHNGNAARAREFRRRAFERDQSIYRAREPYRDTVRRIATKYPHVELVSMSGFVGSFDFIDHCHLTEDKQSELAASIAEKLAGLPHGTHSADLDTCAVTPEYAFGATGTLSDLLYLRERPRDGDRNRIADEARSHPLFRDGADIAARPPYLDGELGRFGDAYVTRLLAPYLARSERYPQLAELAARLGVAPLASRMALLPTSVRDRINSEHDANISMDLDRIAKIKTAIVEQLSALVASAPQMGKRYRTIMYRYFRESVRFGSHSRLSMLYDRAALETAAEAVLCLALIARQHGEHQTAWFGDAADTIQRIGTALDGAAESWLTAYLEARPLADTPLPAALDLQGRLSRLTGII